jgi:hypothetical protein
MHRKTDAEDEDEQQSHRLALHALGSLSKLQCAESFGVVYIS